MKNPIFARELSIEEHHLLATMLFSPQNSKHARKAVAIVLSMQGKTSYEIAAIMRGHIHPTTVYRWIKAFNKEGIRYFKSKKNRGRPRKLNVELELDVWETLSKSPTAFGYRNQNWSMPLLQKHLYRVTGRWVSLRTLYKVKSQLNYIDSYSRATPQIEKKYKEHHNLCSSALKEQKPVIVGKINQYVERD